MSTPKHPGDRVDPERLQRLRVRVAAISALAMAGAMGCEHERPPVMNEPAPHTINEPPSPPLAPLVVPSADVPEPSPDYPPPSPNTPARPPIAQPDAGAPVVRPPILNQPARRLPMPPGNG